MSRPEVVALCREFGPRDRNVVKVEAEECCGGLFDPVGVEDTEGRIRYGVIEEVEVRAVELPRRWWRRRRKEMQRLIQVRFER